MTQSGNRSALFTPRREQAAPARGKSKRMLGASLSLSALLLVTAVVAAGITIGWTNFFPQAENIEISIETAGQTTAGNLEMTGARYSGTTKSGQKFTINAARAVEAADNKGVVRLFEPDGSITNTADGIMTIAARQAVYNATASRLDMQGDVNIFESARQMMLTGQTFTALMDTGELVSESPVIMTGPDMHLTAEGMHASEHGDILVFTGRSQIQIKQTTSQGASGK